MCPPAKNLILNKFATTLPISIECNADSRPLYMDQAVTLGLIINEQPPRLGQT